MKCETNFCIYNKHGKCILDSIEILNSGLCDSCIYVDVDQDHIDSMKLKILKVYEDDDL